VTLPELDLDGLTPEERLDLIERLWDSLSSEQAGLTSVQNAELDRRLDDLAAHPEDSVSWEQAQHFIRERNP
jgi:putative addiction module component (TIGR02574 family)